MRYSKQLRRLEKYFPKQIWGIDWDPVLADGLLLAPEDQNEFHRDIGIAGHPYEPTSAHIRWPRIVLRSDLATGETDEITGTTHCSNVLTAPTVRDLIKKFRGACVTHGFHKCTNPDDGCNFFHRDIGISTRPDERRWRAFRGDRRERYYLDHPRYDKITERWA
mgnify:CR=1 FL=1